MIEHLVNFIQKIKNFGLENTIQRYYSIYRAEVMDAKDPEERMRIKVKIPSLFGETQLPNWVKPRDARVSGDGKGEFFVPSEGDFVFVEFEMGDTRYPIYSGGWLASDELSEHFSYDDDGSPIRRGYVDPSDNRIVFDATKGKQKVIIASSTGKSLFGDSKEIIVELSMEEGKEKFSIITPAENKFIIDDTSGEENITFNHTTGSLLSIDKDGSINLESNAGNKVFLDEPNELILIESVDGSKTELKKESIEIQESSGASTVTITKDGITVETDKDLSFKSKTSASESDEFTVDGGGGKINLSKNKVAIGTSSCEVVDSLIKICDAFLNDPVVCGSPSGPCTGLIGTAKVELTLLKQQLSAIKGSL